MESLIYLFSLAVGAGWDPGIAAIKRQAQAYQQFK